MNKTVIKFSIYGFLAAIILFLSALVFGENLSYGAQEVLGYSSMVLSLIFVFFGIKNYRDKENGGTISFGKAFGIGMLITLFAALGFAIIDFVFTTYLNPEFVDEYIGRLILDAEKTFSGDELVAKKAELEEYRKSMTSFAMALLMFATVILIGFIISLISSLVLHKNK